MRKSVRPLKTFNFYRTRRCGSSSSILLSHASLDAESLERVKVNQVSSKGAISKGPNWTQYKTCLRLTIVDDQEVVRLALAHLLRDGHSEQSDSDGASLRCDPPFAIHIAATHNAVLTLSDQGGTTLSMHVHTHTLTHTHTHTHSHTQSHTHMGAHTHTHINTQSHTYTQSLTHTHTHTHTQSHTHTHTKTHTHIQQAMCQSTCQRHASKHTNVHAHTWP